ncbi:MAG: bacteriochlorophyll 4-vinyl reductase [Betaproteobacteria bacterium]|nr:bacteriochlorophyll 4-vinyl reductase [Betaproteobacteria bacterium]
MATALAHASPGPARIGPNAIVRVGEALEARIGPEGTRRLFESAGLDGYIRHPPDGMVDEEEVTRLHRVLRATLGEQVASRVSFEAGVRTADYLLANRIPKPVQALLKILPAALASRVLLSAISRHAWTFAGSGTFGARTVAGGARLSVRDCPLCRGARSEAPLCAFYAGTFERLFATLVRHGSIASETACEARGAPSCEFRVTW